MSGKEFQENNQFDQQPSLSRQAALRVGRAFIQANELKNERSVLPNAYVVFFAAENNTPRISVGIISQDLEESREDTLSALNLTQEDIPQVFSLPGFIFSIEIADSQVTPLGKGLLEFGSKLPLYFIGSDNKVYKSDIYYYFDLQGNGALLQKITSMNDTELVSEGISPERLIEIMRSNKPDFPSAETLPHLDIALEGFEQTKAYPVQQGDYELVAYWSKKIEDSLEKIKNNEEPELMLEGYERTFPSSS